MQEPEYDIHPLDRDYSSPQPEPKARELSPEERLRRIGVIVFGVGFSLVLLTAILLGAFRGSGWIESFGSVTHRFAMLAILLGGILILVSYRLPSLIQGTQWAPRHRYRQSFGRFGLLLVANVVVFVLLYILMQSAGQSRSSLSLYLAFSGTLTTLSALLVTMVIWHRGMLRAYAVGALIAMATNGIVLPLILNPRFPTRGQNESMIGRLLTIPISGLVCAGYVSLMFPSSICREPEIADRKESA
jgi:hypothetical protein